MSAAARHLLVQSSCPQPARLLLTPPPSSPAPPPPPLAEVIPGTKGPKLRRTRAGNSMLRERHSLHTRERREDDG